MCLLERCRRYLRLLHSDAYLLVFPYLKAPGPSVAFQAMTGVLAMFPHRENNSFRKLITFLLMTTWIVLVTAVAFNLATLNLWLLMTFTAVTMLVYGQMWEIEKYRVAAGPFEIFHSDGGGSNTTDTSDEE
jgi:Ca2+/Na+ antiporter